MNAVLSLALGHRVTFLNYKLRCTKVNITTSYEHDCEELIPHVLIFPSLQAWLQWI